MNTNIDEGNRKQFNDGVEEDVPSRRVVLRGALAVVWPVAASGTFWV